MKKIKVLLLFVFVLALVLFGCGEKNPPQKDPTTDNPGPDVTETTKFTVKFLVDGKVIDTQEVEEGKSATKPIDPIKEGYTFKGWDKEFNSVNANLEVNALFEKNKVFYTVKFLVDGKVVDTQEVEEGKSATRPIEPTKEGYTFKGWDKEFVNVNANLEINAVFEENKVYHKVEFLVEGNVYATVQVEHGQAAELPEAPTLPGKYFASWLKDTSNVTSDMKVRAKFVEVNLTPIKVTGFPLSIGKCELTYWKASGTGYDTNATLYNSKIFLIPGKGNGNVYWYRVFLKEEAGKFVVIEVAERGASQTTQVCDYTIICYTDKLAAMISSTGVKVGDIIQFSKAPGTLNPAEDEEMNEFFTVKRPTDMEAYSLDSDTAHTVVALHKMQLYFNGLGDVISAEKLDLLTFESETEATITWTSSNPDVIKNDGTVVLGEKTEVVLTAVAVYGTSTYKQTYTLVVGE